MSQWYDRQQVYSYAYQLPACAIFRWKQWWEFDPRICIQLYIKIHNGNYFYAMSINVQNSTLLSLRIKHNFSIRGNQTISNTISTYASLYILVMSMYRRSTWLIPYGVCARIISIVIAIYVVYWQNYVEYVCHFRHDALLYKMWAAQHAWSTNNSTRRKSFIDRYRNF